MFFNLLFWLNVILGLNATTTVNIEDTLTRINNLRTIHSAPPVQWDTGLENTALDWAINLNTTNIFQHSSYPYGENLAYFRGVKNATYAMQRSITAWYAENAVYDYKVGGFTAGHFTQLVWVNTKYIGAAFVNGYVVMEFNPPGNYAGTANYVKNVLPPIVLPPPVPVIKSPPQTPLLPSPLPSPLPLQMPPPLQLLPPFVIISPQPPTVAIMSPPPQFPNVINDVVPIGLLSPPPPKSSEEQNVSMSYVLLGICLILSVIYVIV